MSYTRNKARIAPLRFPYIGGYHLLDVRVPARVTDLALDPDHEGCYRLDITVGRDGLIEEISPRGQILHRFSLVQGHGRQLWPGLVDIHAHLDKTATWDRAPNHDGTFDGAIEASSEARRRPWTEDDVLDRMNAAVVEAHAMGTVAIRTHIDSSPSRATVSWRAFDRLRRSWDGKVTIQGVALFVTSEMTGSGGEKLAKLAARHKAAFGPVIYPSPTLDADLRQAFELAERHQLNIDFHVDETGGPNAHGLRRIAELATDRKFSGHIVCGHACSLSLQDDADAKLTISKLRQASAGVVSLPATNLYLQGRKHGQTPTWRGVTRLHELREGGVKVAIAGDNRRDAFYPFGDYDMLDVFRDAVRIAHLDLPMAGWVDAVSRSPAEMMGLSGVGRIVDGAPADFITFPAQSTAEVLATRGQHRQIIRNGRLLTSPKI